LKQFITILFVVFVFAYSGKAQDKKVLFDLDYSRFANNSSSMYVEFYYSFYKDAFQFLKSTQAKTIRGAVEINIKSIQTNEIVVNREYRFESLMEDSLYNQSLIGVLGYFIPNGDYQAVVVGKDLADTNNVRQDSLKFTFSLPGLAEDSFGMSDIQLASALRQSTDTTSVFYKNTFDVTPNPTALYGNNLPVIFFYTELYNLDKNVGSENLLLEQYLMNSSNQIVFKKKKMLPRKNASIVEAGAVNINKMLTGAYTLLLSITDTVKNTKAVTSKRVFVYNPDLIDTAMKSYSDQDYLSSEYSPMSEDEVAKQFEQIRFIISPQELDKWKSLSDIEAQKNFLFEFWKRRDPDMTTGLNEGKTDYFRRVAEANQKFGTFQKEGWKTDRGRVYIVYGEPSEIERFPNQIDTKPYEVWRFDAIQGGVIFVFGDITGFDDYTLLHSTMRGELYDEYWVRRISSMKNSDDSYTR